MRPQFAAKFFAFTTVSTTRISSKLLQLAGKVKFVVQNRKTRKKKIKIECLPCKTCLFRYKVRS